ncbi:MarR family transcriptional regulator [Acidithiobacillus sp. AMEEHan]|uniref:MarR family winged helix-turn-helix transcriptional regulator n=1 Tax=Acidithiobacillus sp. AMEEHan TaxID=2994951 RepID=UPI0027E55B56|nr:MarR family transcriptional regulator [Acidithiobacillus sp. AMEEHan]
MAFLAVLRELAQAYQAFSAYSAAHVRQLGLTPAQFDVIATLGNTQGMPLSQLAQQTLITKGTLTGIIDRLEKKGLVRREGSVIDRRSFLAVLTPAGEALFSQVFPSHIAYLKQAFAEEDEGELEQVRRTLRALRGRFQD